MNTQHHLDRIKALSPARKQALAEALASHVGERPKELAAYYAAEGRVTSAELRAFLEARLPEHLVPAEFVELPSLPKAVNGKLDRRALREPRSSEGPQATRTPVALSELEQRLARIWTRVLQRPVTEPEADFFALGGHSLLATQVVMEIEQQFGVEVPLVAILRHPTLGRLSRYLEGGGAPLAARTALASERLDHAPLSHGQRGLWYASQLSDAGLEYKIVKVLDLQGRFSSAALAQALSEIVRRHEILRTTFGYVGGRLVQRVQAAQPVSVEWVDLRGLTLEQAQHAYRLAVDGIVARPFDLETGPLLRVTATRHTAEHVRVFFDIHHIVVDGWSFGLLVTELNALFRSFVAGQPSQLAALALQYRDVAQAERRRLDPATLDRQIAYWRERLAGAPLLEFRRTRAPLPAAPDGEVPFQLDAAVSAQLVAVCAGLHVTPYMFLAAAYHVLLQAHGEARDIAFGTDVSNRDTADHARLIGFFANQVVLRLAPGPTVTFEALCRLVRDTVEGAFENKSAPYDAVVRALGAGGARVQPFRAMFSFHHQLPELTLPGLRTSFVDARPPRAKYDLLINVEEGPRGLQGSVEYRGALFDAESARAIARQYVMVCEQAVRDVAQPVSTLVESACGPRQVPELELHASREERRGSLRRLIADAAARAAGAPGEGR
jgi:acyl carrier protein